MESLTVFIFKTFSFYLSLFGIFLAILFGSLISEKSEGETYVQAPPTAPFKQFIAASGIVEPLNKQIEVGAPLSGIIQKIWVDTGESVKKGDPLFQIDSRELEAKSAVLEAKLKLEIKKLEIADEMYSRVEGVSENRSISKDEIEQRKSNRDIALAQVVIVENEIEEIEQLISQRLIKAPISGVILQKNIRLGELVPKGIPPIMIGDIDNLQIRTDIDEFNIVEFNPGAPAVAFPKNNPALTMPLTFVKVEPYVKPKQSLTGASTERVDTRVLQVIYSVEQPKNYTLYAGLQVDVDIEIFKSKKEE